MNSRFRSIQTAMRGSWRTRIPEAQRRLPGESKQQEGKIAATAHRLAQAKANNS